MDFEFLNAIRKKGFKKLEVFTDSGKVAKFILITKPRKLVDLIQGEYELRTEIHLTLGSDLLTYGLDKFLLIVKELTGRGDTAVTSTLKYNVIRVKPELKQDEGRSVEKLYYKKVNAPVGKFIDALEPRMRKARQFIKDADEFMRAETREVAAKEIVQRLKKTTEDFGFDRITKFAGGILGRVADMLGDQDTQIVEAQDYQALIFKKKSQKAVDLKPQLVIMQRGDVLRIMGGSQFDVQCENINPELLYDALRFYLLAKRPRKKILREDEVAEL